MPTSRLAAALLALLAAAEPVEAGEPASGAPRLSLPIACELGRTCFIQSYVDVDPGPGFKDFACGSATYEAHSGTDFRVLTVADVARGVDVLAAAEGTVKAVRDEMADKLLDDASLRAVAGRECGNGVVIDHGNGWETQVCHMQRGSVAVKPGEQVARGAVLGRVGYSGQVQFPHVHLTVRQGGTVIDPFSGQSQTAACTADPATARGLWEANVAAAMPYRNGEIIGAAFSGEVPRLETLEETGMGAAPTPTSPQLVFVVRTINLKKGDQIRLDVKGPQGFETKGEVKPLDRNKATYMAFAGKRLTAQRWPAGAYEGTIEVVRGGTTVARADAAFEMP